MHATHVLVVVVVVVVVGLWCLSGFCIARLLFQVLRSFETELVLMKGNTCTWRGKERVFD